MNALRCKSFLIFASLVHGEYTPVKCDRTAFRNNIGQIFRHRRSVPDEHLHQADAAAFQLIRGLEEVPAVGPQARIIRRNDSRPVRAAEACNILPCFKMFSDIFALVEIGGGNDICVDSLFSHQSAQPGNSF